jgi:hypothetical protein
VGGRLVRPANLSEAKGRVTPRKFVSLCASLFVQEEKGTEDTGQTAPCSSAPRFLRNEEVRIQMEESRLLYFQH